MSEAEAADGRRRPEALLVEGSRLSFTGTPLTLEVRRLLGSGGQGQVFAVDGLGEAMALKWYHPSTVRRDPGLRERLQRCIAAGSPNGAFLWPIALLEPDAACRLSQGIVPGSFGYLMELRPPGHVGVVEHIAGRQPISLRSVLRASWFLAEALHALHSKGFCYKDISLGNLFLDPDSGRILLCDNDNVDIDGASGGGVAGTAGFMAPEVLLGRSRPGSGSDLFSLAVLIFRMLTRHDPFRGRLELEIRCLDEPARRRLYGEDPVFIFDRRDPRNRPDPVEQPAPLLTWPIYPGDLQELFQRSLGEGAREPGRRALTSQWIATLASCLDRCGVCPHCGQEVFLELQGRRPCWNCGGAIPHGPRLRSGAGWLLLQPGNELHAHHCDPRLTPSLHEPIGRVESHPQQPTVLGILNLSSSAWTAVLPGGETTEVAPGQRCNPARIRELRTPLGALCLEASEAEADGASQPGNLLQDGAIGPGGSRNRP